MSRAAEKVVPRPASAGAARALPPEWGAERLVKGIGKIPGAAGRGLDRLAKVPGLGVVINFFSSVWVGISILVLLGAYIAIGSGMPSIRERMEMTDLQFFDWYPMRILLVGLVLDLSLVTLRRIPLTLFKLGPWIVHIGIITLIGGSVWYFSQKVEGSVRIYLNKSVNHYYHVTERALFAFPVNGDGSFDTEHPVITRIPTLPIFAEHLPGLGNPVDITLAGALPGSDAAVHISGYYPCAVLQPAGIAPGAATDRGGVGPAIAITLEAGKEKLPEDWLIANSPAQRLLEGNLPFGIEYLRHPDGLRVKDLQTSFEGSYGVTVRIPKLGIDRTYAVKPGEAMAVEGSPYTLTPQDMQAMPMLSKGYENASSSTLTVDVVRKDGESTFNFQRMCVSRYPELSPDFVNENGKMARKQEGVDHDIQIIFHDAMHTQVWIVEGADGGLSVITRTPDGKSTTVPLAGAAVTVPVSTLPGGSMQLRLARRTENAIITLKPEIVPPEQRPRGQQVMEIMQLSMIDVEVSKGGWSQTDIHVPFSPYAEIGERPEGDQPAMVMLPDGKRVGLLLATTRLALPSALTLTKFEPIKYPGASNTYADYRSTLQAVDAGATTARVLQPHLNDPAADHGLFYFQSAWDGDENAPAAKRYSVIGVGNRPGIYVMVTGAILIAIGIGYAFYVKPLLLKSKKEFLARWAAAQRGSAGPASA